MSTNHPPPSRPPRTAKTKAKARLASLCDELLRQDSHDPPSPPQSKIQKIDHDAFQSDDQDSQDEGQDPFSDESDLTTDDESSLFSDHNDQDSAFSDYEQHSSSSEDEGPLNTSNQYSLTVKNPNSLINNDKNSFIPRNQKPSNINNQNPPIINNQSPSIIKPQNPSNPSTLHNIENPPSGRTRITLGHDTILTMADASLKSANLIQPGDAMMGISGEACTVNAVIRLPHTPVHRMNTSHPPVQRPADPLFVPSDFILNLKQREMSPNHIFSLARDVARFDDGRPFHVIKTGTSKIVNDERVFALQPPTSWDPSRLTMSPFDEENKLYAYHTLYDAWYAARAQAFSLMDKFMRNKIDGYTGIRHIPKTKVYVVRKKKSDEREVRFHYGSNNQTKAQARTSAIAFNRTRRPELFPSEEIAPFRPQEWRDKAMSMDGESFVIDNRLPNLRFTLSMHGGTDNQLEGYVTFENKKQMRRSNTEFRSFAYHQAPKSDFDRHVSRPSGETVNYIGDKVRKITVQEYIGQLSDLEKREWVGFRVQLDLPYQEVPINPYFLGLWLGDGTRRGTSIAIGEGEAQQPIRDFLKRYAEELGARLVKRRDGVSYHINYYTNLPQRKQSHQESPFQDDLFLHFAENNEMSQEITDRFLSGENFRQNHAESQEDLMRNANRSIAVRSNWLKRQLEALGVSTKTAGEHWTKHIPSIYKLNSREVHLQLLAGFIDADGSLMKNNRCYTIAQSEYQHRQLTLDALWVARAAGFTAHMRRYWNKGKWYLLITIHGENQYEIPCLLARKQSRQYRASRSLCENRFVIKPTQKPYDCVQIEVQGRDKNLLRDDLVVL